MASKPRRKKVNQRETQARYAAAQAAMRAFRELLTAKLAKTGTGHLRRHPSAATRRKIALAAKRRHRTSKANGK